MSDNPIRLAYFVTHPIQYQVPLLRLIAADPAIELTVFFASDFSLKQYHDPGFGRSIAGEAGFGREGRESGWSRRQTSR